ncbi:MAG: hypothetical protein K2O21_00225, partial [Malacoplasma sp.]|nr:hypothetical protein [Malacoplasma sp.]
IYCTSPVKKVIAEVDILDTLSLNPKILWEKTKKFSGIDKMFFNNYFKNRKIGHAYKLGKFVKYKEEKTLNDFGINYPPQSFCYIE